MVNSSMLSQQEQQQQCRREDDDVATTAMCVIPSTAAGSARALVAVVSPAPSPSVKKITPMKRRMMMTEGLPLFPLEGGTEEKEEEKEEDVNLAHQQEEDDNEDDVILPLGQPLSSFLVSFDDGDEVPTTSSSPRRYCRNSTSKALKYQPQAQPRPRQLRRYILQTKTSTDGNIISCNGMVSISARQYDAAPMKKIEEPFLSSRSSQGQRPWRLPTVASHDVDSDIDIEDDSMYSPSDDVLQISSELYDLCLFRHPGQQRRVISQGGTNCDHDDQDVDDSASDPNN